MDEIRAEEQRILEEFRELGDSFACYSYLLALAGLLTPCPEEVKTDANAVKGCQSSVWLSAWQENGRFRFAADSDTYVIKGFLYLLSNVLDGRSTEAVAGTELSFWKDPLLLDGFDDHRRKGIGFVAARLRELAGQLLTETPADVSPAEK